MTGAHDFIFNGRGKRAAQAFADQAADACVLCGKTAIYRVGVRAYCSRHKDEATKRAGVVNRVGERMARRRGTDSLPE
jgi:hypothetical protein